MLSADTMHNFVIDLSERYCDTRNASLRNSAIINMSSQDIITMCRYTRYKIQDTRFFISGKLPIVHDYIHCLIKC